MNIVLLKTLMKSNTNINFVNIRDLFIERNGLLINPLPHSNLFGNFFFCISRSILKMFFACLSNEKNPDQACVLRSSATMFIVFGFSKIFCPAQCPRCYVQLH